MENELIAKANELAEAGMAMGNGYDPDEPITDLPSALTVIIQDSIDIMGGELYDFLTDRLGEQ